MTETTIKHPPSSRPEGEHTPGPWTWDCDHVETEASGHIVAHVYGQYPTYEANARLIAAAPEMLEALKAVAIIRNGWPEVFDQVDAAIAKATPKVA